MTRSKNFGSPTEDVEPLQFELFDEVFHCKPEMQGATLLTFSKKFTSEDMGEVNTAFLEFFQASLKKESYQRFLDICESEDKIVKIETLGKIAEWLVEEYTDRPTQGSKNS